MGRLTERFSNGQAAVLGCGTNCEYDFKYCESHLQDCPTIIEIYEKLAHYEDLEEQGYKMVNTDKVVEQLLKNAYKVTEKNTNLEHAVIGLIDVIKIVKGGAK